MATDMTIERLRQLAEIRSPQGKVLSVFIDLDPREFATPPARASEISSVLDEAARTIRDADGLTPEERTALEADLERVRAALRNGVDTKEARALAVFASQPAALFEILKLPRPVAHKVAIGDTPCVEPLARIGTGELWWLVLVDRKHARLLAGTVDGLVELWRHEDDALGRVDSDRQDQDGRSEKRYERSVEQEVDRHLRGVGAELRRRLRSATIGGLLIGGPHETTLHLERLLEADVKRCVQAHFEVDVWNSGPGQVLQAARPRLDEVSARRDEQLLARIAEGLATEGRAAAGLTDVLSAVHERRVDTLVVQDGFAAMGTRCPQCGWLGISASGSCPADGIATESVANVVEVAVARALSQNARVRHLPASHPELESYRSIAALLRF